MRRASNVIGSRQGDTNHSVFAMVRTDIKASELLLANAHEIPERLGITRSSRSYYDHARIRGTIPVTTAVTASNFVGIRGRNRSRQRIRYLWAVAAFVGELIAAAVSDDFRLFR